MITNLSQSANDSKCYVFVTSVQIGFSICKKTFIHIQLRLSHIAGNNVFVPLRKLTFYLELFLCSPENVLLDETSELLNEMLSHLLLN